VIPLPARWTCRAILSVFVLIKESRIWAKRLLTPTLPYPNRIPRWHRQADERR
jgi:hypothetical protein